MNFNVSTAPSTGLGVGVHVKDTVPKPNFPGIGKADIVLRVVVKVRLVTWGKNDIEENYRTVSLFIPFRSREAIDGLDRILCK